MLWIIHIKEMVGVSTANGFFVQLTHINQSGLNTTGQVIVPIGLICFAYLDCTIVYLEFLLFV